MIAKALDSRQHPMAPGQCARDWGCELDLKAGVKRDFGLHAGIGALREGADKGGKGEGEIFPHAKS